MMFLYIAFEVALYKTSHSDAMIIKPCCSFSLEFLQQCLLVMSRSFKGMLYTYHLKDDNNHNSFLGTDSHLQSISR